MILKFNVHGNYLKLFYLNHGLRTNNSPSRDSLPKIKTLQTICAHIKLLQALIFELWVSNLVVYWNHCESLKIMKPGNPRDSNVIGLACGRA